MAAPKFGTLVPNRIFVGGISPSTSEAELAQLFSAYGTVKATKIIADGGGASRGYGFVTFETEEEATRLQQESECIVLRERKLNIAPAIKKQSFNRSFDGGSGSPPVVPTSTYYYANGMGLPYQNGMTFYNAGAPAPGAGLAPPTDPTTLYQAAGVFGPQATSSHQTFAPMMYPMPTPSIYMPQQYQYSPMPYEPYFPGAAAGGPPFMYTSNGGGSQNQSGGGSTGNSSGTGNGAGNSSSPYQSHLYGGGPNSHHALTAGSSGSQSGPPQSHQMEHIYYSYPPPHVVQQHQHHTGPLNMADQQLLIYSEIAVPPPQQGSANESLINQEVQSFGSQQQQQRFNGQRGTGRYPPGGASGARGAPKASAVRQSKFKINGVAPTTTATTTAASVSAVTTKQQQSEDAGGGDAPVSITRLPLTPPGTPQQQSPNGPNSGVIGSTEQQIQESCHQIQALSL